jgi:uncharacterized membrane protein YhaH (DUF805 family)
MDVRLPAPGSLLPLWFGFNQRVDRRAYLVSGLTLMIAKYLIDALIALAVTGAWWAPWRYLWPLWTVRMAQFQHAPSAFFLILAVMTLPFFWIGLSMSVRRAIDAGRSPFIGLGFAVPGLNFVVMAALSLMPSAAASDPQPVAADDDHVPILRSALSAMVAASAIGVVMGVLSVRGIAVYGFTLFFITPLAMGVIAGYLVNRPMRRSVGTTIAAAAVSAILAGGVLLLLALEGLLCVAMAAPIALAVVFIGGLLGRHIAIYGRPAATSMLSIVAALPLLGAAETATIRPTVHEVVTITDIDATPDVVWTHVIGFTDLPQPSDWVFHTGIAYPTRASIAGAGIGAVRTCEFSTGAFIEPITEWKPGQRLAFDVSSQPPPMMEWSFYANVHPPHLDTLLRSRRGEFRLIRRPDGGTRLEGHTWYELEASPTLYWRFWSDAIIHRIHARVLAHVKQLSEENGETG